MGTEFVLLAKESKVYIGLGKMIYPGKEDPLQLQGAFSEYYNHWCPKGESWTAIQQFLMDTIGATLVIVEGMDPILDGCNECQYWELKYKYD